MKSLLLSFLASIVDVKTSFYTVSLTFRPNSTKKRITQSYKVTPPIQSPGFEGRIFEFVGESFAANSDSLEHSVAGKLMHDQTRVDPSRLFDLVGNDATHEMRVS